MTSFGINAPFGRMPKHSDAIPKFGVRYLFIPHPFATNHTFSYPIIWSVRLACLSHAASVRSEPGSNPSVYIVEIRPLGTEFFEIRRIDWLSLTQRKPFDVARSKLRTAYTEKLWSPRPNVNMAACSALSLLQVVSTVNLSKSLSP